MAEKKKIKHLFHYQTNVEMESKSKQQAESKVLPFSAFRGDPVFYLTSVSFTGCISLIQSVGSHLLASVSNHTLIAVLLST